MPRHTHSEDGLVYACPACDVAGRVYRRTDNARATVGDPGAEYVCEACSETFDEPVERESKSGAGRGGGISWLEQQLNEGAEVQI